MNMVFSNKNMPFDKRWNFMGESNFCLISGLTRGIAFWHLSKIFLSFPIKLTLCYKNRLPIDLSRCFCQFGLKKRESFKASSRPC